MTRADCLEGDKSARCEDDDVGLHVLGCRVNILGTNCKKRGAKLAVRYINICKTLDWVISPLFSCYLGPELYIVELSGQSDPGERG